MFELAVPVLLLFCFSAVLSSSAPTVLDQQMAPSAAVESSRDGYGGGGSYGGYGGGGGGGYGVGGYGGGYGGYGSGGNYYVSSSGLSSLSSFGDLLTGVLATLAGLALLAALATALAAPLAFLIGRKRRDVGDLLPETQRKMKEMEILQTFIRSMPDFESQPQRLMANYLSCTGLTTDKNRCLERLTCEFENPAANFTVIHKGAMAIIFDTITSNNFLPADFRDRLQDAATHGKTMGDCKIYSCSDYFKSITGS